MRAYLQNLHTVSMGLGSMKVGAVISLIITQHSVMKRSDKRRPDKCTVRGGVPTNLQRRRRKKVKKKKIKSPAMFRPSKKLNALQFRSKLCSRHVISGCLYKGSCVDCQKWTRPFGLWGFSAMSTSKQADMCQTPEGKRGKACALGKRL